MCITPSIWPHFRRPEKKLWKRFWNYILHCIFAEKSGTLKNFPTVNYFEKHFLSRGKRQLLIWNPKKESTKISGSKWKKVRSRNLAEDSRRDFLTSHFVHSPRRALLCSKIPIKCTVKNKEAEFENFLVCNESTPWYCDVRRHVSPENANTCVKLISASPILDP